MADEDHENKTEQPSEKRLREAREKGQFARSSDIAVAAGLLASGVAVTAVLPAQARQIAEITTAVLGHLNEIELRLEAVPALAKLAATTMLVLCLPVMCACAATGVLVSGLQSGFRLSQDALGFKAERLNPVAGFKKVFSMQGLTKLGFDVLKLGIVGFVLKGAVRSILTDPVFFTPTDLNHLGSFFYDVSGGLLKRSALGIGIIAATHYFLQRRKLNKQLMMSKQEIKEEHEAQEGDPHVKAQRKAMARRMLQKQMLSAVGTADVIVTNPTHYAVALRYERGRDRAPIVLAKGKNRLAERIKALGAEHDVPRVENVPLAQALYKSVPVGQPINAQLYNLVAEVLAFVYRTHRYYFYHLKARRAALETAAGA